MRYDLREQLVIVREREQRAVELQHQWDISLKTRNHILATCLVNPLVGKEREQYKFHKARMSKLERDIAEAEWSAELARDTYDAMVAGNRLQSSAPKARRAAAMRASLNWR
jgi:hypothetical protein